MVLQVGPCFVCILHMPKNIRVCISFNINSGATEVLKDAVKRKTDLQVSSGFGLSDAHNVALPHVQ